MNLEWNIAGVRAVPQMPASLICPFSGWRMLDAAWESLSARADSGADRARTAGPAHTPPRAPHTDESRG